MSSLFSGMRRGFGENVIERCKAGRGVVAVKDLTTGDQVEVPHEQVAGWLLARREAREQ